MKKHKQTSLWTVLFFGLVLLVIVWGVVWSFQPNPKNPNHLILVK